MKYIFYVEGTLIAGSSAMQVFFHSNYIFIIPMCIGLFIGVYGRIKIKRESIWSK